MTCISLCVISLTEAQTGNGPGFLFLADSLYRKGHYFDASIAYERVLFDSPNRQEQYIAITGKLQCLKKQSLYDQAVTFLEAWQAYPFPDSSLASIHYQQVLCTYLGGHFENVLSLVDRWPYTHAGAKPAPLLVVLKILSLNELQQWTEAAEAYRAFMGERQPAGRQPDAFQLPPDLYTQLPHLKSVSKAQALSTFIPGAGLFYAGKPGEAIFSILVQAAGVYFVVLGLEQHYYVSAWLIGAALFGAFHMGSVRRSEVLVQRYNRKKILQFNEKVKEQLLEVLDKR